MKTWKAYYVIYGDGYSRYPQVEFEIDDHLFARMEEAIHNLIPLRDCDFYEKLIELADEGPLDPHEYLINLDYEPVPEDYEDEEEYQECLAEYQDEVESRMDEVSFESCVIDDPGDLLRLKKAIIGKKYPKWAGKGSVALELEESELQQVNHLVLEVDNNGVVADIRKVSAEALEEEGFTSSSYGEVYPNYEFIQEWLREEAKTQNC